MRKSCTLVIAWSLFCVSLKAQTTYFTQNFNSGSTLSTYVASPPAANQFDVSLASGTGSTVAIVSNKLQIARTAGVGGASATRYTGLGMPTSGIFQLSLDFDCAASTGASGTVYFTVGNITSTDGANVGVPADASSLLKLKFYTDNTTSGNFYIQNLQSNTVASGRAPASGSYSGTQNVIAIFNNTISSADYTSPAAVKSTVGAMKVDVYVNNVLVIDEGSLCQTTPVAITGLKLNVSSNNGIANFDNITLKDAKTFKVIAVSDPSVVTQQLTSGNFTLGFTDNGGGMINQVIVPGVGDIMGTETDRYGRGGQSAIRSMATTGTYNPTQAGFNETIGTQCVISSEPGKLTIHPRGVALWWSDAKYDYTQWENVGSDSFNSDGGNTDTDGINESALPNKQADEVGSEFDYYGTYEDYMNKNGITTSAIRHYYEYRFDRTPGSCIAQFSASSPVWNPVQVQNDLSYQYPAGVFTGTDQDLNFLVGEYALRNDISIWNPAYRYTQDLYGNWQVTTRDSDLTGYQNKLRQVFMIAESSDKNTGKAIGMYYPATDVNMNPVIGVNESDGSIAYKDNRVNNSFIKENRYRISTMSSFGFNSYVLGLINRNRLPSGVYEAYRRELYIFYGTPQEIMTAISALDTSLGIQTQPSNVYFKQDFNSSVITNNYVGTTTNLLNAIKATGTTGAMGTATVTANKLNLAKTNAGNSFIARSTSLGLPSSGVFEFKYDFDCSAVSGSSTNGTPFLVVGRNIDPNTVNIVPDSNSYVKVKITTDNTNSGNFIIQNLVNSVAVNTSLTLSGTNTFVMIFNNSGSTANYLAPDGSAATLANNKWDLYANNNLIFNDVNVNNTSQAITGFKLSLTANNTNINLDNMLIADITTTGQTMGAYTNSSVLNVNSLSASSDAFKFDVYKSQGSSYLYKIYSKDQQQVELSLISLDGKVLSKKVVQLSSGNNSGGLATSSLNTGLYLVRLKDAKNRVFVKKVMVSN
ncbi:T9SS type A sorting domain-containing protein [Pelobium sp.]|nr:T9SS type A sorting domain-containing protein [Pelobium sp.]MDA9554788.1 T9SS type A sorting domain-containing protein [Pelobium sp.]